MEVEKEGSGGRSGEGSEGMKSGVEEEVEDGSVGSVCLEKSFNRKGGREWSEMAKRAKGGQGSETVKERRKGNRETTQERQDAYKRRNERRRMREGKEGK